MSLFKKIKNRLTGKTAPARVNVSAADGYDLWSATYDDESWNLMVALDEQVFPLLLNNVSLKDKVVLDIGCGTGRHWRWLLEQKPLSLTGFDVSGGMVDKLKQKYPGAEVNILDGHRLNGVGNNTADIIISTLAFAHFEHAGEVIKEWSRVLKPGGHIFITDAHPASFEKGGDITFGSNSKTYQVAHYIYPLDMVRALAKENGLEERGFSERVIDSSVRHFYESQNAIATYKKFEGVPLIYGIHFSKNL